MILMCAAVALAAWMLSGRPSENVLSMEILRKHWTDTLDLDLTKEYILEKVPVILHIVEILGRSFGLNRCYDVDMGGE